MSGNEIRLEQGVYSGYEEKSQEKITHRSHISIQGLNDNDCCVTASQKEGECTGYCWCETR